MPKTSQLKNTKKYKFTLKGFNYYLLRKLEVKSTESEPKPFDKSILSRMLTLNEIKKLDKKEQAYFYNVWMNNSKESPSITKIPEESGFNNTLTGFIQLAVELNQHQFIKHLFEKALNAFREHGSTNEIRQLNLVNGDGLNIAHLAAKYGHVETLKTIMEFDKGTLQKKVNDPTSAIHSGTVAHVAVKYRQHNILDFLETVEPKCFISKRNPNSKPIAHMLADCMDKHIFNLLWRIDRAALFDDIHNEKTPIETAIEKNNTQAFMAFLRIKKSKSDLHKLMTDKTSETEYLNPRNENKNIAFYLTQSASFIMSHIGCLQCLYKHYRNKGIFNAKDRHESTPLERTLAHLGYANQPNEITHMLRGTLEGFLMKNIDSFDILTAELEETFKKSTASQPQAPLKCIQI